MICWSLDLFTAEEEETREVGRALGEGLLPGDVVALSGELGAGKTCMTQGIARGLQVPESETVRSPTFVLLNIYPGRCLLHHLDLYRLQDPEELEDLGYREVFFGDGVAVVEWAERAGALLPVERLHVHMRFQGEAGRRLLLRAHGERFRGRRDAWARSLSAFVFTDAPRPGPGAR